MQYLEGSTHTISHNKKLCHASFIAHRTVPFIQKKLTNCEWEAPLLDIESMDIRNHNYKLVFFHPEQKKYIFVKEE